MTNSNASVLVTANNEETRAVITSVISKSLQEAGFTDVNAIVEQGDLPVQEADKVSTMLDLVRANSPEMFNTPVTISRATYPFSADSGSNADSGDAEEEEAE